MIKLSLNADCIKDEIMSYFEEEEAKLFSICNVPWTFNLKRSTLDEHNLKPPCSVEYAVHQSLKLMEFFYKTSAYLLPNCRGTTSFFLYHLYRYQNSFNFLRSTPSKILQILQTFIYLISFNYSQ